MKTALGSCALGAGTSTAAAGHEAADARLASLSSAYAAVRSNDGLCAAPTAMSRTSICDAHSASTAAASSKRFD